MRNIEYEFAKTCLDSSAYRALKNIDVELWLSINAIILFIWSIISLLMSVSIEGSTWPLYFTVSGVIIIIITILTYIVTYFNQLEKDYKRLKTDD